jgi:hypothetical protein
VAKIFGGSPLPFSLDIRWQSFPRRFPVFTPFLLAALLAPGPQEPAPPAPVDLKTIPRVIQREPVYQGAPKYCLLVFGKDARTRIWLVQDGTALYVDRQGNGDLTAPGNKMTVNPQSFAIDRLVERDGTMHRNLQIYNTNINDTFSMELGDREERQQYVGIGKMERPSWGSSPENAPLIHFNGPMTLGRYGPIYTVPRMGANDNPDNRRFKLRLLLGTPGVGKGTFASYNEACSENLGNIQADIVYASKGWFEPMVRQRIELEHDG